MATAKITPTKREIGFFFVLPVSTPVSPLACAAFSKPFLIASHSAVSAGASRAVLVICPLASAAACSPAGTSVSSPVARDLNPIRPSITLILEFVPSSSATKVVPFVPATAWFIVTSRWPVSYICLRLTQILPAISLKLLCLSGAASSTTLERGFMTKVLISAKLMMAQLSPPVVIISPSSNTISCSAGLSLF